METCPTCGSKVKIVGHTTMHYEPIDYYDLYIKESTRADMLQDEINNIKITSHNFKDYEKKLHKDCDEGCFYRCSKGGIQRPECL